MRVDEGDGAVTRVVLVTGSASRSGAENVLSAIATYLVGSGTEVDLLSPTGPVLEGFPRAVRHHRIPALGLGGSTGPGRVLALGRMAANVLATARVLRRTVRPGDVVVVNSLFALPVLPVAFPRGRGGVTVSWLVHDTVVSARQRLAVRAGARVLDRAVAVSEITAESVSALVARVEVRVNGVALPDHARHPVHPDVPTVGILAALTPWKGHEILLEALSRVPGAVVEIAGAPFPGDVGYADSLRRRAEQEDLRGRVRFLGHADRTEVLGRWDVAVSASVLPEAGPLGVLECMAAGVPVIASDHGGAAEYLRGGAGVLVPVGDPVALARELRSLLADVDRRREISRVARDRAEERFDLTRTLPEMVDALLRR